MTCADKSRRLLVLGAWVGVRRPLRYSQSPTRVLHGFVGKMAHRVVVVRPTRDGRRGVHDDGAVWPCVDGAPPTVERGVEVVGVACENESVWGGFQAFFASCRDTQAALLKVLLPQP